MEGIRKERDGREKMNFNKNLKNTALMPSDHWR